VRRRRLIEDKSGYCGGSVGDVGALMELRRDLWERKTWNWMVIIRINGSIENRLHGTWFRYPLLPIFSRDGASKRSRVAPFHRLR
jgi:hypothetical protein